MQLEHDANFRDVSPELERYRKYASKFKVSDQEINSYYSKYHTQGLASAIAEEKKCQPAVDLRNDVLGEVRDQGGIGWCYAFVSADLLTYKLGKKISAADIAMNYNDRWDKNILKMFGLGEQDFDGATKKGIRTAIAKTEDKGGACLEANVRSEDNGNSTLMSNLVEIDNIKRKFGTLQCRTCLNVVQRMFPTIREEEFMEIAKNASRATLMSMLSDKVCHPRLSLKEVEVEYTSPSFFGDTTNVFDQIDRQLNSKNILALSYNENLLFNRSAQKFYPHASTIVGRRFNKKNGECEYLVRNSKGQSCGSYDSYYDCEAGNVWVPKSVLSKGVINVSFIK